MDAGIAAYGERTRKTLAYLLSTWASYQKSARYAVRPVIYRYQLP